LGFLFISSQLEHMSSTNIYLSTSARYMVHSRHGNNIRNADSQHVYQTSKCSFHVKNTKIRQLELFVTLTTVCTVYIFISSILSSMQLVCIVRYSVNVRI
jgi:hypothetical protein